MTTSEPTNPEAIPAELLPLAPDWPQRPIGDWLDDLAAWIAKNHPTPLELPSHVVKTRAALGLPAHDHLVVTTNHAALTLSPWNLARCLIAEELTRRLRARGVAAHSLVLPLDHNTLGDANRPAVLFLGGRAWTWPGTPRQTRRVVATIELQQPDPSWRQRIHDTLLQDAARAWQMGRGHDVLGRAPRRAFVDRAKEATERVLGCIFNGERSGRADLVWSEMQRELLDSLGLQQTILLPMARVELALAAHAPCGVWEGLSQVLADHPGIEESLGQARSEEEPGQSSVPWSHGAFWFLCDPPCKAGGTLQPTRHSDSPREQKAVCGSCGKTYTWSAASAMEAVQEGKLHPRVHHLVLWMHRGIAPIIHTAGPQMISYAPGIEALERHLAPESTLPPQIFLPLGRLIPAVVLSSLFVSIMPSLEKIGSETVRGTRLWQDVVNCWAATGEWDRVEKRLGPRLRDGGFAPPAQGQGVLETALREWGWWPPQPSQPHESADRGGTLSDDEASDLVNGFLAWARPFRWAGGWDWLWSGLDFGSAVQSILVRTLSQLTLSSEPGPNAPGAPVCLPRWYSSLLGESSVRKVRARWEALLTDR